MALKPEEQARLAQLIGALNDFNPAKELGGHPVEVEYALVQEFGSRALEPLLAVASDLNRTGQLTAINVLRDIGDERTAGVIAPWLTAEDDVVRQRVAELLGDLGAVESVPELLKAWSATESRGTPPSWTEPAAIRRALRRLGGRAIVLPDAAAVLLADTGFWDFAWPAQALTEVLEHLAEAQQAVLYFQFWEWSDKFGSPNWYWVNLRDDRAEIDLDFKAPWTEVVESSKVQALKAAAAAESHLPAQTFVTVEWVDRSDIGR